MEKAEIISQWVGAGTELDSNRPRIGDDFAVSKWEDVTGQPSENLTPNPNNYTVYVEAESAVMDAIAADANYYILWREEIIEGAV